MVEGLREVPDARSEGHVSAVDIRCPENPVRLFFRIDRIVNIDGANLIEVACRDCRNQRRAEDPQVSLVLHRFNVAGELVETEVQ
jgi:hypothetical protein